MHNKVSEFGMTILDATYPRMEAWVSFFATINFENVKWKALWIPLKAVDI